MLSCIIGNKSINSFDYEEYKLRDWSNKKILRCPECGERVIYCNGDYKIAYFKHEVSSECKGNLYYEPITEEHIVGIKKLYNKLKIIEGIENLEVEKYIVNTKQRPDIYFEYKGQRYCIEYQCSPIATQYNKRHELYELEGIKDIWILGTSKYNFKEYDDLDNSISFKEKKIKSIENSINNDNMPLLYLDINSDCIYKINTEGFMPIIRDKYKHCYDNNPLKTIISMTLNKKNIKDVCFDDLTYKENLNISQINEITHKTIVRCEGIANDMNSLQKTDIDFYYNLNDERFPMYTYKLGNVKTVNVFDDIECIRFEEDIDKYITFKQKKKQLKKIIKNISKTYREYTFSIGDNWWYSCKNRVFVKHKKYSNLKYTSSDIFDIDSINGIDGVCNEIYKFIESSEMYILKQKEIEFREQFRKSKGIRRKYDSFVDVKNFGNKIINTINSKFKYLDGFLTYKDTNYNIVVKCEITGDIICDVILSSDIEIIRDIRCFIAEYKRKQLDNLNWSNMKYVKDKCKLLRKTVKDLEIIYNVKDSLISIRLCIKYNSRTINIDFLNNTIKINDNHIIKFNDKNFKTKFNTLIHDEIRIVRYGGNI